MIEEQVIRIIATRGPVVPAQIAKEIGSNTMIAGAVLSKLASEKRILISHVKIGGSPVYYLKEQAPKLQELSKYLNEKDKKTFETLKTNKILRDNEQDALTRVSLRNIKDFATPLEVTFGDRKEIFWKWYLISDEEAAELIREHFKNINIFEKEKKEDAQVAYPAEEEKHNGKIKEPKEERTLTRFVEEKTKDTENKKELAKEEKKEKIIDKQIETCKIIDNFADKTIKFLKEKGITIKNIEVKKKNSEIDIIVSVPTIVGDIEYYCKAKNKSRINENDISSAYVQGQLKKLPVLFVTTGSLTKKASQMLEREFKINILKI
ncbi:MAG: hypothetical protein QXG86_01990 [Candidatus Woesearchaeota archaeon]